jgi:MtrB/PioB family decaheme-associated outer membrane protein
MIGKQKIFWLTIAAAALLAAFGPARADDDVDALTKPESRISFGIGNWSNDRQRLGFFDCMRNSGAYGLVDASIVRRVDATGTWYKFSADDLGLTNRRVKAEYLRQGNIGVTLEYNRIPRSDPNVYHTNLQGAGTTRLVQENAYASTAADLANGTGRFAPQTQTLGLGTVRQQTGVSFYKSLVPGLELNAAFKNEEKDGTRNWSRGGSPMGFFAVEPIDSTTRQLDVNLSYATEKFQLKGGYYGSWYQNNTSKLMMIGPASMNTAVNDNTATFLSLPLDNQAHQLYLNGGYNFTKSTRGTFKIEYARAMQNDHNPSTDIANLSNVNPPSSLHAKVDTTLIQLGLNSRVTKDFTVNGSLRYYNKDDKTPIFNYLVDTAINPGTGLPYPTYPYFSGSYKTLSGKVEGVYRLNDGFSLAGGLDIKQQTRPEPVYADGTEREGVVPFRGRLNETTARFELRRAMTDTLNGSLSWIYARRTGSDYTLMENNNFLVGSSSPVPCVVDNVTCFNMADKLNPMSVADRTRNKVRMATDWSLHDKLSLQFVAEYGRDQYGGQNPYGLEKGTTQVYSVDLSWTPNDKFSFNAWYSYDKSKAKQTGFLVGSTDARRYDLQDGANSLGVGVRWTAMPRLHTGLDLEWTRGVSKYNTAAWNRTTGAPSTGGVNAPDSTALPSVANLIVRLKLFAQYALNKQSELRFDFIHERWKTNDWSWQYNNGTPFRMNDGTYVTTNPKQISNFVGIRYIYRFQ